MAPSDIDKDSVLAAIAEYDKLGQSEFLARYNFGKASKFRLVHNGRFYDSKAIAGVAHGFATNDYWMTERPFGGTGPGGAVTILEDLGFFIDRSGLLHQLNQLHVDRTHGKRAPYQYVVLLWAIARARDHAPRLVPFNDVRRELAGLLAPFAIASSAPDPAMPWAALGNSELWELVKPDLLGPVTDADVKRLNISGGLSEDMYWRAEDENDAAFVEAAVDVIAHQIGAEPAFTPLVQKLGLHRAEPDADAKSSPDVIEAIAAVESVSHPRRKIGGQRFTAAEIKAIEERAVQVTRQHFENELGYATEDVGATSSYDVHATKGENVIKVEVKGTTTAGEAVILTRNEVKLHLAEHPNNAFALVRNIALDRNVDPPVATGGELNLSMPWVVDIGRLEPIAYTYRTVSDEA
ncbi:protein NO VEIN domain-containing protein [Mycolicibacterium iranicum]|uniref:Uncharacterized protein n=1 Tax=Mycolicibacterium iranicum TaxID=912594 RepID=A0A178LZG7_MYCIR|nr:DUF3883 domain-containing protein [Mycolicibacterium iranicum]OAN40345.1 hypothetical protein A4X20_14590 [Mycolicibacterium iranicum]